MPMILFYLAAILATSHPTNIFATATKQDADGESMWGHIYMEDGATSFEFFRALFGGKFPCKSDGHEVAVAKLTTTVINDEKDPILIGDGCEAPTDSLEGKFWVVNRGTCSFNDKAIVAEKAGAEGLIVVNNAPGLLRMPPGVLKQKKNVEVNIPAVMITEIEGQMLYKFLQRDEHQRVRIIGEMSVKGKLLKVGSCSEESSMEIGADGKTSNSGSGSGSGRAVKLVEGGVLHLDGVESDGNDNEKITHEFLRGMFGGPLPRSALPLVVARPENGCSPIENVDEVQNKIVIVVRGQCMFTNKGTNVEKSGASGMIVINNDTPDITRMWAGENEMRAITIPSVMVTGVTGKLLLEHVSTTPDQGVLMRPSSVKNEHWQQIGRFLKISDWPEDDDEREELFGKLLDIHDPSKSAIGHRERKELLEVSYNKAEKYYDSSSVSV